MIIEYHSNIFKLWASIKSRKTVVQYVEICRALEDTRRYKKIPAASSSNLVASSIIQEYVVDSSRFT